jgi:hypothetical protein
MVGRWPSGAPLMEAPQRDDPARATNDQFEYGADPDGFFAAMPDQALATPSCRSKTTDWHAASISSA